MSEVDEFDRVPLRKAAAGPAFDERCAEFYDHEFYVGVLEDKGFTYDQAEQVIEYLRECFGAYKLEFQWVVRDQLYYDGASTAFWYVDWAGDYEDEYTVFAPDCWPVLIIFDLPDFRRAVRDYACGGDADPLPEAPYKPGMIKVRQEMVEKLTAWQLEINDLLIELKTEIQKIESEL